MSVVGPSFSYSVWMSHRSSPLWHVSSLEIGWLVRLACVIPLSASNLIEYFWRLIIKDSGNPAYKQKFSRNHTFINKQESSLSGQIQKKSESAVCREYLLCVYLFQPGMMMISKIPLIFIIIFAVCKSPVDNCIPTAVADTTCSDLCREINRNTNIHKSILVIIKVGMFVLFICKIGLQIPSAKAWSPRYN